MAAYLRHILNRLTLIILALSTYALVGSSPAYSMEESNGHKIFGSADTLVVSNGTLLLQGWAGAADSNDGIKEIKVTLNDYVLYRESYSLVTRMARPDVNKALEKEDWVKPGWQISTSIPNDLDTGVYQLHVEVTSKSGNVASIPINEAIQTFAYSKPSFYKRVSAYKIPAIAAFGFGLLLYLFLQCDNISLKFTRRTGILLHPALAFSCGIIALFLILLTLGITGSSFGVGVKQTPFIKSDTKVLWGIEQPIRSDEWLVLTPNAIAQANHVPRFPMVNSNLGEDGQNMLIIGMAGVPVAHISQIAKPATWGYYIFDLKRAVAWNWLFPIFSCLLALWAVLCNLKPGSWRHNFVVAFTFSTAAYVVAWSNWPAYTVFFPCIVYLSAIGILNARTFGSQLALGLLLGIAFSGFVLVLYPPWQISLTYVFIAVTAGKLITDKSYKRFTVTRIFAYLFGLAVSFTILYAWWTDARLAIEAMQNTIYPGLRTTLLGGDATLSFLLRGFTNFDTLEDFPSPVSNQSEIASFYYMLLPLLTLFIIRAFQKSITAVEISLAVATIFIFYFMFFGIPVAIAEYSLWGRVPGKRADLAFGFCCLLLTAMLTTNREQKYTPIKYINAISLASTLIWTIIVYKTVNNMHESITSVLKESSQLFVYGATLVSGFLLARGAIRSYFVVALVLSATTTYYFNPVVSAPKYVNVETPTLDHRELLPSDRVLALETSVPAMYLLASGVKVVNGIFYYPPKSIWKTLDPHSSQINVYNRYQHLRFYVRGNAQAERSFILENPGPDRVEVSLSPEKFDFRSTAATVLIAPAADTKLRENPSLTYLATQKGWVWYAVNK